MSELSLSIQKEVYNIVRSKAFTVNGNGDIQIDGLCLLDGIDGRRALKLFFEAVKYDVLNHGEIRARELYYRKSNKQGSLGKALRSSVNLSRMLDAEDITRK